MKSLAACFKIFGGAGNDNRPAAWHTDMAALTMDFGEAGTYEKLYYFTVEPEEGGTYAVYAGIGARFGRMRFGDSGHRLVQGGLGGEEALKLAEEKLKYELQSRPEGKERGEIRRVKGTAPVETLGFRWQPVKALQRALDTAAKAEPPLRLSL